MQRAAGVGAHEIRHGELLLAAALVQTAVSVQKLLVNADAGLAHEVQHAVHTVLRRHPELAGDMVLHQLGEEGAAPILQQIVIADAAADKDLFHAGQRPQPAEQPEIIAVVGV